MATRAITILRNGRRVTTTNSRVSSVDDCAGRGFGVLQGALRSKPLLPQVKAENIDGAAENKENDKKRKHN